MTVKRKVGRPRINIRPEQIRDLRDQGLSFRKIAAQTGFGYGSVRRALKAYENSIRCEAPTSDPVPVQQVQAAGMF